MLIVLRVNIDIDEMQADEYDLLIRNVFPSNNW